MITVRQLSKIVFVAARLIAGGMYLAAGVQNLLELESKASYTASKGVPNPIFWVVAASLLLVFGGFSVVTGIRPYLGVAALVLFLIPVTLIMHNFWALTGIQAELELHAFMSNAALFGSVLMFLAIPQPWPTSLDRWVLSRVAMLRSRREGLTEGQSAVADA